MKPDVLDRLNRWASFQQGEIMPNNWGPELHADLVDAIAEIERLRSIAGAVSDGPSMADIKRDLRGGGQ